jgi:hypothetical protein
MKLAIRVVVIIIASIVLEATAFAQPTAESLFAEGQTAYSRGDYATAIAKWQVSYEMSGETGLLFNIAQALRLSGNCPGALATYKHFIVADTDLASEQHKLAEDFERELEGKCGGSAKPITPSLPNTGEPRNSVNDLNLVGKVIDSKDRGRTLRIAGLATGGTGLVLLATGLVLGRHGQALGDDVTEACRTSCDWSEQKNKDAAGRRDVMIGRLLDGVGLAAIVGGAVLYYVGNRQSTISVSPRSRETGGGASISWSGSW